MEIAYLRLFENQPRSRTFIQGAWREFGSVNMLRSAASITPAEYRQIRRARSIGGIFIDNQAALLAGMRRSIGSPLGKGWHRFRQISATTITVRDPYGSYPPKTVLCHGAFWKIAVDILLTRVDLVVLDLSGLVPKNRGTIYELQRVIDRFPIERVVMLTDPRSNRKFVKNQIQTAWMQMEASSPNNTPWPRRACVAITDRYHEIREQDQHGQTTTVQTKLVARRAETRRLAASVNRSLAEQSMSRI